MDLERRTTFPALRCIMGDWTYYVTYMRFSDVAAWVKRTDQVHRSKKLRDMIQRELTPRAEPIAAYLVEQQERFFNAIVVGVYGGMPQWYPIKVHDSPLLGSPKLDEDAEQSIGLLVLSGTEDLFAIDGQHRVEAIKQALKAESQLGAEDLAVIFVAHHTDTTGQRRTRRLFSTLNRYAKPVSKGEIVALDEDDAFAIVTRLLVEEFSLLSGFVRFGKTTPLPQNDRSSLTSILALYDIVETIHTPIIGAQQRRAIGHLKIRRPPDEVIDSILQEQMDYWRLLRDYFPEYDELFSSKPEDEKAAAYRGESGGHLMFRPVGQKAFAQATRIMRDRGFQMEDAIAQLARAPMSLAARPWTYVLWNPHLQRVNSKVSGLLPEAILLFYAQQKPRKSDYDALGEYRKLLEDPGAVFPVLE